MPGRSNIKALYIHIPFCEHKCNYCDFYSVVSDISLVDDYLEALEKQWASFKHHFDFSECNTVYVGGGTPSILNSGQWERLSRIWENFPSLEEVNTEVNPASLTTEKIQLYQQSGVHRISMGIQSFQPSIMKKMGRIADFKRQTKSLSLLKTLWKGPWSLDLIYGYPGTELEDWLSDLKEAASWKAPHLSVYQLTLEPHTALSRSLNQRQINEMNDRQNDGWDKVIKLLEQLEYQRYEISNFTKDKISLHNMHYWKMDSWLGLGAGASSFLYDDKEAIHITFPSDLNLYLNTQWSNPLLQKQYLKEKLSNNDYILEIIMMGLRSREGIYLKDLSRLGLQTGRILKHSDEFLEKQWLKLVQGRLYPTSEGMDFHNAMVLHYMNLLDN